jgi:hypothetical protein
MFHVQAEEHFTTEGAENAEKVWRESLACLLLFFLCVLRVLCGEKVFSQRLKSARARQIGFISRAE